MPRGHVTFAVLILGQREEKLRGDSSLPLAPYRQREREQAVCFSRCRSLAQSFTVCYFCLLKYHLAVEAGEDSLDQAAVGHSPHEAEIQPKVLLEGACKDT